MLPIKFYTIGKKIVYTVKPCNCVFSEIFSKKNLPESGFSILEENHFHPTSLKNLFQPGTEFSLLLKI
jgi:hypothetical protein